MRSLAVVVALALGSLALNVPRAAAQDAQAQARTHFERGVALYDEGRLAPALAEFLEANRIASSSAILYNVAQVEAELGHAVEAVDAYEQLLREATTIQASMRSQIESALTEQRARIATLDVDATAPGALVALDDIEIGAAPLHATRISAGEHVVSARANGYETARIRFIVAGGATHSAHLTMTLSGAAVGSVRVDSRVPGVEVVIDGVSYGLTPLASAVALAAGSHHVEGRRAAYSLFSQDVTVAPGSESRATLIVESDPAAPPGELGTLRLAMPAASATLRIDGAPASASEASRLSLPEGLHDVEVRVADREPFTARVELIAEQTYDLRPPYVWTPEAREWRVRAGRAQAELGWGLLIGGGVAALAGAIATIAVWADYSGHAAHVTDAYNQNCAQWATMWSVEQNACRSSLMPLGITLPRPMDGSAPATQLQGLQNQISNDLNAYYAEIITGAAIAAIGGVVALIGVVELVTAASENDVDRSARASRFHLELFGGPGSLTLRGTF